MKIRAIDEAITRNYPDTHTFALITEPRLTDPVFQEARRHGQTPGFQALRLRMDSGCLIVSSPQLTPEHVSSLEQLLTQAEDAVRAVRNQSQKQAETMHSEKQGALKSASRALGLPVQ
jgi:hypothetical protein